MTKHIVPRFKLMLFYDLAVPETESYYQFVMNELIPAAQEMDLYIFRAFHTIPNRALDVDYPMRQVEFVAEELETVYHMLDSETWLALENQLQQYIMNYSRKIVRFRPGFQF